MSLLLVLFPLSNCGSPELYPQRELAGQIIYARAAHPGVLVNQACLEYDKDKCKQWSVKRYDLNQAAMREQLDRFRFVCKIANRRFKVCLEKPGFCRTTYKCTWLQEIFGGCDKEVEFLPLLPHEVLVNGNTRCFSEKRYGWTQVK